MYPTSYNHYSSSPNTNTSAPIYQQPMYYNTESTTYGPGPTRRTPTIRSHAPPLRSAGRKYSSEALLGPDAPTQPRNYITPSITSRKDIPSYFLKRRPSPTQVMHLSDDEDDELTEEPPAENATDQEKIDYKRRQNTLAARRSRRRKLMYTQKLEATVERLSNEKEMWRTRAQTLRQLLMSHNMHCPDFKD